MYIFAIARTALVSLRRDRASLALSFVLPIGFFSIFATIFGGMVQVAVSGQLLAIAEVDRGEIVPRRVFNLTGIAGRADRRKG